MSPIVTVGKKKGSHIEHSLLKGINTQIKKYWGLYRGFISKGST